MSRHNFSQEQILKDQTAFGRAQREERDARLCRAARENPDLPPSLLAQRFGLTTTGATRILEKHGVRRSMPRRRTG